MPISFKPLKARDEWWESLTWGQKSLIHDLIVEHAPQMRGPTEEPDKEAIARGVKSFQEGKYEPWSQVKAELGIKEEPSE